MRISFIIISVILFALSGALLFAGATFTAAAAAPGVSIFCQTNCPTPSLNVGSVINSTHVIAGSMQSASTPKVVYANGLTFFFWSNSTGIYTTTNTGVTSPVPVSGTIAVSSQNFAVWRNLLTSYSPNLFYMAYYSQFGNVQIIQGSLNADGSVTTNYAYQFPTKFTSVFGTPSITTDSLGNIWYTVVTTNTTSGIRNLEIYRVTGLSATSSGTGGLVSFFLLGPTSADGRGSVVQCGGGVTVGYDNGATTFVQDYTGTAFSPALALTNYFPVRSGNSICTSGGIFQEVGANGGALYFVRHTFGGTTQPFETTLAGLTNQAVISGNLGLNNPTNAEAIFGALSGSQTIQFLASNDGGGSWTSPESFVTSAKLSSLSGTSWVSGGTYPSGGLAVAAWVIPSASGIAGAPYTIAYANLNVLAPPQVGGTTVTHTTTQTNTFTTTVNGGGTQTTTMVITQTQTLPGTTITQLVTTVSTVISGTTQTRTIVSTSTVVQGFGFQIPVLALDFGVVMSVVGGFVFLALGVYTGPGRRRY